MRTWPARVAVMFAVLLGAGAAVASAQSASPGTAHAIDATKSKAQFSIEHIFVDHVTGSVPVVSGSLTLPADSLVPTAVSAVLDATKLRTDEPDRDAALESPDYFDAKRFPSWTFVSTAIVATGPATFGMDGVLTMHGIGQPEHLEVTLRGDRAHPLYHAVGTIDRHAFGMRGARLDPVIGATATVTLDIAVE